MPLWNTYFKRLDLATDFHLLKNGVMELNTAYDRGRFFFIWSESTVGKLKRTKFIVQGIHDLILLNYVIVEHILQQAVGFCYRITTLHFLFVSMIVVPVSDAAVKMKMRNRHI